MLIGHYAVGLASKRLAPRTPLWLLIAAAGFLDLLWPIALALGLESVRLDPTYSAVVPIDLHDYPYTHSLAMAIVWSLLLALGWLAIARDRRGAIIVGLVAASHWFLDWVTHPPDIPLWPGSATHVGLDLWASRPATVSIELVMLGLGAWLYASGSRPRDRTGTWALWSYVLVLIAIYLATVFGPPPPSASAVTFMALAAWPLLLWPVWIERHRV
jgi:membrane-bound metal-dependent hydrolase YbcI (DUF457 family)